MQPGPADVATTIVCVECGETAHLLTTWPDDDPPYPGDVMAYRCSGCADLFYVELADDDTDQGMP